MTSSVKVDEILISRDIFRSYDIRGVSDSDPLEPSLIRPFDLTARQAWLVGKAFGTWIQRSSGSKIVVGRDNRRTSLDLSAGFILGALSTGCQIIDIDFQPPQCYILPSTSLIVMGIDGYWKP